MMAAGVMSSASRVMASQAGSRLGPYEVTSLIQAGGMADV